MKKPKKTDAVKPARPSWLRRAGRRLWRLTLGLLLLLVSLRLVLWAGMPWFLERTLAPYDLSGTYEKLHLSILTGNVELWHLSIAPTAQPNPLTHLEYCKAEVSLWTLLRGRLVIPRVEVDGLDVMLRRQADGNWIGWEHLGALVTGRSASPSAAPATEPASDRPLDLAPPFKIDALRLQHVQVTLQDEAVTPPVETRMDLNLRLSDLGSPRRPTRFQLMVTAEGVLDKLTLEGTALGNAHRVTGTYVGVLQGAYPAPVASYLAFLGTDFRVERIDGGFSGFFELAVTEDANRNPAAQTLTVHATVHDVRLVADNIPEVTLDSLALEATLSDANGVEVQFLHVSDGRLRLIRDPEGGISLAGLYLKKPDSYPSVPSSPPATEEPSPPPVPVAPVPASPSPTTVWSVGKVNLQDVELVWEDKFQPDVPPLNLHVETGTIGPIAQSTGGTRQTPLQGRLRLPGIVGTAQIAGQCDLISRNKYVELTCDLQDVTPKALGGYLTAAHLASEHESARLTGAMRWSLTRGSPGEPSRHSLAIRDVKLTDRGQILAALDYLTVQDLAWDGIKQRLSIERIAVQGDQTTLHWDAEGRAHLWGFGWAASPSSPSSSDTEPRATQITTPVADTEPPTVTSAGLPAELMFRSITWDVGDVTLIDETKVAAQPEVRSASLRGALENIALNMRETEGLSPGRVELRMAVPGLLAAFNVIGTVTAEPSATGFELAIDGSGLEWQEMATYLKPLGLVSHMDTGVLQAQVEGRFASEPSGWAISAALKDCVLKDAQRTYFSLSDLRIDRFRMPAGAVVVHAIDVNDPMVSFMRDPNGLPILAGLSWIPRPEKPQPKEASPLALCLDRLAVQDARLVFEDQRMEPPVHATLAMDVRVTDANTLTWDTPALLQAQWRLPGIMEQGTLQGSIHQKEQTTELTGDLHLTGIHPELVAHYLPAGSTPLVQQGRLNLAGTATLGRDPNGGNRFDVQLKELDYREANEPAPWVHLDRAQIALQTPAATQVVVDELTVSGLEARLEQGRDGRFHALGLALGHDPQSVPERPPVPTAMVAAPPSDANTPTPPVTPRATRPPLPDLTVRHARIDVRRVTMQDFGKPAEPLVAVEALVLENTDPIELLGENAATKPPAKLTLQGRVTPFVDRIAVRTEVAPYAAPSSLKLDYELTGIHGAALTDWLPALADRLDASDVTEGRATGHLEVAATVARRRATEFDFRQAFGLTLAATDLRFTHGDGNDVWTGLSEAHIEIPQIDIPRQRFDIRTIELIKPQFRVIQEPNGLRIMNMLIKKHDPAASPDANTPAVAVAPNPSRPTFATPPRYQVRLDQILISGLDLVYRDVTVTPPLYVPLNGLDLDVRGLVYPVPTPASPVRFNTIMTAGRVPVAGPNGSTSERFLFQELTATGNVTPGEQPNGWIKAGVKGLEMRALSGLAQRQGIQIRNGLLDVGVDVRLKPARRGDTTIKLALTDLSLRDSSDGIIAKVLLLPVSLDTAIYMLQGIDGSIRMNVPFTLDLDTLSPKQLNTAIVGATAAVLGKAVATSPVKLVTGTTKLVSETGKFLTGTNKPKEEVEPVEYEPIELIYEPGAIALNNALRIQIEILAKYLRQDRHLVVTARHQFGIGDLIVAERLANPSAQDNQELLNQLRHLKDQMQRQRMDLASRAQAAYGAGDLAQGRQLSEDLAEQDDKLGLLEQACDNLLESFGPGSAQLVRRRTREAALSLARARLITMRDALHKADIKDIQSRLNITQPSYATPEDNQPGRIVLTLSRRTVK